MRTPTVGAIARDFVLTAAAAEAAVRLLRPADPHPPRPADLHAYFSAQEFERGRRFARPQMALGAAAGGLQFSFVALAALRSPRALRKRLRRPRPHPLVASAGVAAGLAVARQSPALPFAALARRRALAAGLATQTWRGWAADLVKARALRGGLRGGAGALW